MRRKFIIASAVALVAFVALAVDFTVFAPDGDLNGDLGDQSNNWYHVYVTSIVDSSESSSAFRLYTRGSSGVVERLAVTSGDDHATATLSDTDLIAGDGGSIVSDHVASTLTGRVTLEDGNAFVVADVDCVNDQILLTYTSMNEETFVAANAGIMHVKGCEVSSFQITSTNGSDANAVSWYIAKPH